jgi:SAM-dependent methyltransferase
MSELQHGNQFVNVIRKFVVSFDVRTRFISNVQSAKRILDLGCGRGVNSFSIREVNDDVEIHGVDILPRCEVPDFIYYQEVDIDKNRLPYQDDFFDVIIFTHVIEHLRTPLQLGKEINRVLKKGGEIYIETPNWTTIFVPSFGFHREQHFPFNFFDDQSHLKPWTKQGLYEFLSDNCGFRVQKVGTVRNWLRVPFDFVRVPVGLMSGNRKYLISAFWNLYGWCIYGVGSKY